ncbi:MULTISPECIES: TetR/AcrR family transcriptional regulator [unclassified Desulfovibrio]|uniref:TetR/AcrR family transcriptional regulator n=1 Tax=unclassified Desulfovibrio TaxID=2593640 RepID=UPI0013ED8699|nr:MULTISPECIES: TetR/AcrR family transcriptional regulator [unclassified Desulfovibrio]
MPRAPKKTASPPDPAPRGRPREFDRDAALNAAMETFWRKGYMQTTLADLCQAMGISAPSFYCAFGTREDIFLETVAHYKQQYWDKALDRLMQAGDVRTALKNFVEDAVQIYMRPGLPKGCFVEISTVGLAPGETRIIEALAVLDRETEALFRKRLLLAIEAGELPPESDVPAIVGALIAFMKGVALLARGELCQAELAEIARRGLALLPNAGQD